MSPGRRRRRRKTDGDGDPSCRHRRRFHGRHAHRTWRRRAWIRHKLHRRIFVWFGLTIFITLALTGWIIGDQADAHGPGKGRFFVGLAVAGMFLWGSAGFVARRLVRPLGRIARVARDIGNGQLDARVGFGGSPRDSELAHLGEAIDTMAGRIQKQLTDQRALLAAVSHEIRTPLGHMRVIAELARGGDLSRLDELEREIAGVDTLVDQLLASSRLEFDSFDKVAVNGAEIAIGALERANLDASVLDIETDSTQFAGDAMLISRALGNLLENAARHGGGATGLRVAGDGQTVRFSVEDRGPGFDDAELVSVFDTFLRGDRRAGAGPGSLGLGLALVDRIARAHGGRAWAENRAGGGALVAFEVSARGQ